MDVTKNGQHNYSSPYQSIMASVSKFKSGITRIRDILRGPGVSITGMDSMRHICLYLLSRYMTRDKVTALKVPEAFAWETLIDTARTQNGGVQKALDSFYHLQEDCLVLHFDRLFGTQKFAFDIKHPQKHKDILEILDGIHMTDVDCHMDLLGWVYEQHLKTGSSSSGRDLGQFFTDRSICEYMTQLCTPALKKPGIPESVCDPSMGTGGFLTSFIKYYKTHHHPTQDPCIDWSIQQQHIHGNDTDPRVAGVARLNLFMETGGCCSTNLLTHDSLYGDLTQSHYDIILANMPFGLKGIKYADCCDRVKDLGIPGTKSEPLFLQLMMVSLNPGGRCAVVVPDGMLVNQSKCHDATRKYLLDHFQLQRIIKMKGQFFMNTAIQPSILFFKRTGPATPTTTVEFWEIVKTANGTIEETKLMSVSRDRIDASASSSLDLRRYEEELKQTDTHPSIDYPLFKLSDVCDLYSGKGSYTQDGDAYPYYDSNGITGTRKDYLFDGEYIVTARKMSIGSVHYVSGKFWPSDNTINIRVKPDPNPESSSSTSRLNSRFLYYWLLLNNTVLKNLASGIKPGIRKSDVAEIRIPLPPLSVQTSIVDTLDYIHRTELADLMKLTNRAMDLVLANPNGTTLEPILEALRLMRKTLDMAKDIKAQMAAIIKASMRHHTAGCKTYLVSELADDNPENITKSDKFETIQYVDLGSVKEGLISLIQTIAFEDRPSRAQRKIRDGDILWGGVRPLSRSYAYIDSAVENMIGSSGFVVIRNRDSRVVLSKYLYYCLTTNECVNYLSSHSTGTSYPAFNAATIMAYTVVVPPISVQTKTLERLRALESQLISMEALRHQSEDNARFMLESYLVVSR